MAGYLHAKMLRAMAQGDRAEDTAAGDAPAPEGSSLQLPSAAAAAAVDGQGGEAVDETGKDTKDTMALPLEKVKRPRGRPPKIRPDAAAGGHIAASSDETEPLRIALTEALSREGLQPTCGSYLNCPVVWGVLATCGNQ